MKGVRGAGVWGTMAVVAIAMAAVVAPPATAFARPSASAPVVVELFTAQGCSGCPDANALLEGLAARPGVIALTYAVDYWDYLGWSDTFARPAFAARQRDYQARLSLRTVYTPQVIVGGAQTVSGIRDAEVSSAVDEALSRQVWPPEVEFRETGDRVGVGSGRAPEGGADVWLVRFQPGPQVVAVGEGENRGLEVRHINVVREIVRLGEWRGRPILLDLPDAEEAELDMAILVQARDDGRILAAARR